MLKIEKNLLHLLHEYYFKFDTNPTVDLGETTIWNKTPEVCHGIPSMFISCTHIFHEQTLHT